MREKKGSYLLLVFTGINIGTLLFVHVGNDLASIL